MLKQTQLCLYMSLQFWFKCTFFPEVTRSRLRRKSWLITSMNNNRFSLYITCIRCKLNDYEQYNGKVISAIIQYLSTSMVWQILQFRSTFFYICTNDEYILLGVNEYMFARWSVNMALKQYGNLTCIPALACTAAWSCRRRTPYRHRLWGISSHS